MYVQTSRQHNCAIFLRERTDAANASELQFQAHIEGMELLCDQLTCAMGTLDIGAVTHSGSAALSHLEQSVGDAEISLLRLQAPVRELRAEIIDARRRVEDQADQVKKLQEKLVSYHRKTVSMSEEIRSLENARQAMDTERRCVAKVQEQPDSDDEDRKVLEELDQVNRSMQAALDKSTQEISRLQALLEERDIEVVDLQGQLEALFAQRQDGSQRKIAQMEEEEARASRESAIREQFLELSLNRSMQETFVVQGVQVRAHEVCLSLC